MVLCAVAVCARWGAGCLKRRRPALAAWTWRVSAQKSEREASKLGPHHCSRFAGQEWSTSWGMFLNVLGDSTSLLEGICAALLCINRKDPMSHQAPTSGITFGEAEDDSKHDGKRWRRGRRSQGRVGRSSVLYRSDDDRKTLFCGPRVLQQIQ